MLTLKCLEILQNNISNAGADTFWCPEVDPKAQILNSQHPFSLISLKFMFTNKHTHHMRFPGYCLVNILLERQETWNNYPGRYMHNFESSILENMGRENDLSTIIFLWSYAYSVCKTFVHFLISFTVLQEQSLLGIPLSWKSCFCASTSKHLSCFIFCKESVLNDYYYNFSFWIAFKPLYEGWQK